MGHCALLIGLRWLGGFLQPVFPWTGWVAWIPSYLGIATVLIYDTILNPNAGYAKHAISIDENRADFRRGGWSLTAKKQDERDAHGNLYFEQV